MMLSPRTLVVSAIAVAAASPLPAQHTVPARFEAGRVFVDLPVEEGEILRMYTDSGGGGAIIFDRAALRLRLAASPLPPGATGELAPGAATVTSPPRLSDPALPSFPAGTLVARAFPPSIPPQSTDSLAKAGSLDGSGLGIIRTAR